ncbi:threonine/serine exporter [Weissella coleopterorum]|uniref:Threonine/serine exporter n=1 Tax=Weissella coleopterorum TaxID=2714949 RepID=A0A6G8AYH5_9LACO|nr:threonine/serine exporter family protein [Weissella coleopterorum]QIL50015.1 threonine/serine exporter [Weissella coleopterorum]
MNYISFGLAFLSSYFYGVIANVPRRALLPSGVTGAVSWGAYLLVVQSIDNLFLANIMAAFLIGVIGLLFAKKYKVPSLMIYVGALIPLVPGGMAFETITSFTKGNINAGITEVFNTVVIAIGLVCGFSIASLGLTLRKKKSLFGHKK